MHWVIESLIWAGLLVGLFLGITLFAGGNGSKEKNAFDVIAIFVGLFLIGFCGSYMLFRFFILMNDAIAPNANL